MPENKEEVAELTKKIAEQDVAIANVVGELKDDREKRRILIEENDALKKALEDATKINVAKPETGDITEVVKTLVEQKLSERDASSAKSNQVAAVEKFVTENKEFHPENDVTGKLREALDAKLKMFNTVGVYSVEDFYSVIKDAASLLGVNTPPQTSSVQNPYSATTRTSITPNASDDKEVSPLEKKLIDKNGWTKERYLTLKAKSPEYMTNLIRMMQG